MVLNPDKSEAIVIGTTQQLAEPGIKQSVTVAGSVINVSDAVKIVGVTIDAKLTFDKHVSNVCAALRYHIHAVRHIRRVLDVKTAGHIARCTILSRLDYCNSLLTGISQSNILKMHRVQNAAARVVCNAKRCDHATALAA